MLTQPIVPVQGAPQQSDPGLWKKFLMALEQNPNLQQSLMTTGLSMLGDAQPGESGWGTFSRSALGGVQQYNRLNELARTRQLQQQQVDLQKAGLESLDEFRKSRSATEEKRTGLLERGQYMEQSQFSARMQAARDKLENDLKIANIRAGAMKDSASAGATGAERLHEMHVNYLMETGAYPDTAQGRAAAGLRAMEVGEVTPDTRMRMWSQLVAGMQEDQQKKELFSDDPNWRPMTTQQIAETAMEMVDAQIRTNPAYQISEPPEGGETAEGTGDPLDGMEISAGEGRNRRVVGVVKPYGETGKYVIETPDGRILGPIDEAEARRRAGQ
jgi:hypothetical protein